MKKQGALYLKLLSISLAGLTVLSLVLHFLQRGEDYSLQEVIYCEVGDGLTVSGFVVREEQLLFSASGPVALSAGEGQWISGGASYGLSHCCAGEGAAETALYAPRSGYFSAGTDGFEHILSYARLQQMTPREFASLLGIQTAAPRKTVGKLVYGQTWYFAALLPEEADYPIGERLTLDFGGTAFSVTLCHRSAGQEGKILAIFSCAYALQEVLNCRQRLAVIRGEPLAGLQIPKAALYHLDGATGVYVLVGQRAKWKEITVLRDLGEDVLVSYSPQDLSALRPEDVLILTTQEIENGKVIR